MKLKLNNLALALSIFATTFTATNTLAEEALSSSPQPEEASKQVSSEKSAPDNTVVKEEEEKKEEKKEETVKEDKKVPEKSLEEKIQSVKLTDKQIGLLTEYFGISPVDAQSMAQLLVYEFGLDLDKDSLTKELLDRLMSNSQDDEGKVSEQTKSRDYLLKEFNELLKEASAINETILSQDPMVKSLLSGAKGDYGLVTQTPEWLAKETTKVATVLASDNNGSVTEQPKEEKAKPVEDEKVSEDTQVAPEQPKTGTEPTTEPVVKDAKEEGKDESKASSNTAEGEGKGKDKGEKDEQLAGDDPDALPSGGGQETTLPKEKEAGGSEPPKKEDVEETPVDKKVVATTEPQPQGGQPAGQDGQGGNAGQGQTPGADSKPASGATGPVTTSAPPEKEEEEEEDLLDNSLPKSGASSDQGASSSTPASPVSPESPQSPPAAAAVTTGGEPGVAGTAGTVPTESAPLGDGSSGPVAGAQSGVALPASEPPAATSVTSPSGGSSPDEASLPKDTPDSQPLVTEGSAGEKGSDGEKEDGASPSAASSPGQPAAVTSSGLEEEEEEIEEKEEEEEEEDPEAESRSAEESQPKVAYLTLRSNDNSEQPADDEQEKAKALETLKAEIAKTQLEYLKESQTSTKVLDTFYSLQSAYLDTLESFVAIENSQKVLEKSKGLAKAGLFVDVGANSVKSNSVTLKSPYVTLGGNYRLDELLTVGAYATVSKLSNKFEVGTQRTGKATTFGVFVSGEKNGFYVALSYARTLNNYEESLKLKEGLSNLQDYSLSSIKGQKPNLDTFSGFVSYDYKVNEQLTLTPKFVVSQTSYEGKNVAYQLVGKKDTKDLAKVQHGTTEVLDTSFGLDATYQATKELSVTGGLKIGYLVQEGANTTKLNRKYDFNTLGVAVEKLRSFEYGAKFSANYKVDNKHKFNLDLSYSRIEKFKANSLSAKLGYTFTF